MADEYVIQLDMVVIAISDRIGKSDMRTTDYELGASLNND